MNQKQPESKSAMNKKLLDNCDRVHSQVGFASTWAERLLCKKEAPKAQLKFAADHVDKEKAF